MNATAPQHSVKRRFSASVPLDSFDPVESYQPQVPSRTSLSFEVMPPRHDVDETKIDELLATLGTYRPDYISVTSSRNSGWLEGTARFIEKVDSQTRIPTLAHLACTAGTRQELIDWINRLMDSGVRGFLALRGDYAEGQTGMPAGYLPHATDLISLIRSLENDQRARFGAGRLAIGVAAYPSGHEESVSRDEDIDVLLAKQRLGADFAITQLFFDAEDYLRFAERARLAGVRIPLIPGIMPMTSLARLRRMGQLSGLTVPDRLTRRLEAAGPEGEYQTGLDLTAELARTILAAGAGGMHVYTFNRPDTTTELLDRIGIPPRPTG